MQRNPLGRLLGLQIRRLLAGILTIQFILAGGFVFSLAIASPGKVAAVASEPPHVSLLTPHDAAVFGLNAAGTVAVSFSLLTPNNAVWHVTHVDFTVTDGKGHSFGPFAGTAAGAGLYNYSWIANTVVLI